MGVELFAGHMRLIDEHLTRETGDGMWSVAHAEAKTAKLMRGESV